MNITEQDINEFIKKNGKRILKSILVDFLTSLDEKKEDVPLILDASIDVSKVSKLERFIKELEQDTS